MRTPTTTYIVPSVRSKLDNNNNKKQAQNNRPLHILRDDQSVRVCNKYINRARWIVHVCVCRSNSKAKENSNMVVICKFASCGV